LSEGERYESDLADPSIFHQFPLRKGGRSSVADEYSDLDQPRETAIYWKPADNNELGTRNRINEYLRVDPTRIHPIYRTRGAPRIFFLQRTPHYPQGCYHVLKELKAQRRKRIGMDMGKPIFSDERDPAVIDHAYDNIRYLVASRPGAPVVSSLPPPGTFAGVQRQLKQWQRRHAVGRGGS
jgi:hypothetical protein